MQAPDRLPDAPDASAVHISVCICTYKRPGLLQRLLRELESQETAGRFTYSIVVVDNDETESAKSTVMTHANSSKVRVRYCLQPIRNIARTRNMAVENADGDLIAFIDDDEYPTGNWLLTLLETMRTHGADGALGPVRPHFDEGTPEWIIKGRFFDRPELPTGLVLKWAQCRSGNVLFKRSLCAGLVQPFRPECLSGEDQDFFRRMIDAGHVFVWCSEAPAYEVVPPPRWKRGFLVRRAMFRGLFSVKNRGFSLPVLTHSLVAAPVYLAALPVVLMLGQARFMSCVFKLSYHAGRLLAMLGFMPIAEAYVSE